ncbi:hypothetical protein D3C81_1503440 [compost metagenome]
MLFGLDDAGVVFGLGRSLDKTDTRLGLSQVGFALLGGGQAVGDFLAALVHRLRQRRPHEFHREPAQNEEHEHLENDRRVQIHGRSFNTLRLRPHPERGVTEHSILC